MPGFRAWVPGFNGGAPCQLGEWEGQAQEGEKRVKLDLSILERVWFVWGSAGRKDQEAFGKWYLVNEDGVVEVSYSCRWREKEGGPDQVSGEPPLWGWAGGTRIQLKQCFSSRAMSGDIFSITVGVIGWGCNYYLVHEARNIAKHSTMPLGEEKKDPATKDLLA